MQNLDSNHLPLRRRLLHPFIYLREPSNFSCTIAAKIILLYFSKKNKPLIISSNEINAHLLKGELQMRTYIIIKNEAVPAARWCL